MSRSHEDANPPAQTCSDPSEAEPTQLDGADRNSRRHFLVGAVTSVPALAYLYACDGRANDGGLDLRESRLRAGTGGLADESWGDPDWEHLRPLERAHRRRLRRQLLRHVREENEHDLDGIMRTLARDAEMVVNGVRFDTPQAIADAHAEFGMSEMMGGLVGTEVIIAQEYFTEDAIMTRGRLRATHVGIAAGFPGAGLDVELAYTAFYQFNRRGRLVSERITMDWGPLLAGAAALAT